MHDVSAHGSGCRGASGMPSWMAPHAAAPAAAVAAVPPSNRRLTAVDIFIFFHTRSDLRVCATDRRPGFSVTGAHAMTAPAQRRCAVKTADVPFSSYCNIIHYGYSYILEEGTGVQQYYTA